MGSVEDGRLRSTVVGRADVEEGGEVPAARTVLWYAAGLRFACTQCGRCCSGASGYVWVTTSEIEAIAELLGLPLDEFGRRHLRRVGERHALVEVPVTGDCVFLRNNLCAIHEARPAQCRSYPWWSTHLADAAAWRRTAAECEGIDPEAPLVESSEIERLRYPPR